MLGKIEVLSTDSLILMLSEGAQVPICKPLRACNGGL